MPTSKLVFENQPIDSEILTQANSYKRTEVSLLADVNGHKPSTIWIFFINQLRPSLKQSNVPAAKSLAASQRMSY